MEKGLNFIPYPSKKFFDCESSLRRLLFSIEKQKTSQFTTTITYRNPLNLFNNEYTLNSAFIDQNVNVFNSCIKQRDNSDNLSNSERSAFNFLSHLRDIIVKPADKGSLIVIQNKDDYLKEVMRQLNDPRYYNPLEKPYYSSTAKMISKCIGSMLNRGEISSNLAAKLNPPQNCRSRLFIHFPKYTKRIGPSFLYRLEDPSYRMSIVKATMHLNT